MASTKKAAAAALKTLDLTKSKQDDGGKLRVEGLEKLASQYRDTQIEIEMLVEAQKDRKRQLIEAVGRKRLAEEKAGRFYKTCSVATDDEEVVYVIWGDRYNALDPSHEPLLKRAVGKHYDTLFNRALAAKAEKDARLEDIQKLLGPVKFDELRRYLTLSETLKLRSGFMEARAKLRTMFDATTNESIDVVVGQVQHDPSVKVMEPKD